MEDFGKEQRKLLQIRFGKLIKQIRIEKGLTLEELANLAEVGDKSNMLKLENGKYNPSLFVMTKLCLGLNISLEEFFRSFDSSLSKKEEE